MKIVRLLTKSIENRASDLYSEKKYKFFYHSPYSKYCDFKILFVLC